MRVSRGRCASSVRLELEREESRSARLAEACVRLQLCMITCEFSVWCVVWARFRFHIVWGTKCVQVLVVFARYDCFAILCVDGERGRAGAGRPRPGRSGRGRVRLRGTAYLGGGEPEM